MNELFKIPCNDRSGDNVYSIRLLHEFTMKDEYFNPKKVSEIYSKVREHDVLFSDYTAGKAAPFLTVLFDPKSIWMEIFRETGEDPGPVGIAYITDVIPKFDAVGHFAFFDRIASGREVIIWRIMGWLFKKFELHRISAETPKYQSGTIRFIRRLGFTLEGEMREAVIHKGSWVPLMKFGITVSEFADKLKEAQDG